MPRAVLIVFLIALLAATAQPWGFTGHHIVAIIAEQRLTPATREKIRALLMDGKYSLTDISTCADQLRAPRGTPTAQDLMCKALAGDVPATNATWHYVDIPVPTKSKTLAPFCKDDNCVTARIQSFSEILRTSQDAAQRRQALLFLVHFMGDIHQPLHATERACDRGGNSEHVNFFLDNTKQPNQALHHVWDTSELELLMKHENITDERVFAGTLLAAIKPGDAAKWVRTPIDQIAWESYQLAVRKAYRGIPFQDFCGKEKPAPMMVDLTPSYERDGTKVVHDQLMKAGVRLAAILEADFGGR